MTAQEAKRVSQEIKAYTKKLSQLSPKEAEKLATELLVKAGICTKKGNLKKPYRKAKKNV